MANTLMTEVHLIHVPLENDYKHTLHFNSLSEQETFFKSKAFKSYRNVMYQRKDKEIYIPEIYDDIYSANYIMYRNNPYTNKWYYAFIKELEYENDECTKAIIETDVIQTWLFDYEIKQSFVEREHVDDDTIGKHTISEGLDTGEYICNRTNDDGLSDDLCVAVAYHDMPSSGSSMNVQGGILHGIYTSAIYSVGEMNESGIEVINNILNKFDVNAKADAVSSVFMIPKWIVGDFDGGKSINPGSSPVNLPIVKQCEVTKLTSLNGYTPRNKKLLTHEYYYLYASNGCGGAAVYHPELVSGKFTFNIYGSLTPGCSIKMIPLNYNGVLEAHDHGLVGGKFPTCCWVSDAYTNWLTQNSINNGLSAVAGAGTMIAGAAVAATGAGLLPGLGMIAGGAMGIFGTMAQHHQASLIPDQVRGNTNSGDVITGMKANKFTFYSMTIRKEYAEIIDKYFDMFGYKVNNNKIPNKNHRSRYWFTKTIDANIDGNIPQNDIQKIKECYNNGITFWRNVNEIQNYSLSNDIL